MASIVSTLLRVSGAIERMLLTTTIICSQVLYSITITIPWINRNFDLYKTPCLSYLPISTQLLCIANQKEPNGLVLTVIIIQQTGSLSSFIDKCYFCLFTNLITGTKRLQSAKCYGHFLGYSLNIFGSSINLQWEAESKVSYYSVYCKEIATEINKYIIF